MPILSQTQIKQIFIEYVPYLLFVMAFSWISSEQHGFSNVGPLILTNVVLLGLTLMSKKQALAKHCNKSASAWYLLAFIGIPLGFFQLSQFVAISEVVLSYKFAFFLWLIAVESLIRLYQLFAKYDLNKLKQNLAIMDYIAIATVLFFSLLWALLFNSIDDPLNNQPIQVFIDVSRNVLRFDEFLGYFFQVFALYTCGFVLYWVNHHLLINKVLAKFGVFHYLWVATVFTLIASPVLSQLALLLPINSHEFTLLPSGNQDPFDSWNLRFAIAIMVLSTPVILAFKWQQQAAEFAQLKQQSTQAELKWLQQQINPHFLFNTLNNLYSLTLAKSDQAPESILQLSSLLRFVVYKGGQDKVLLREEIEYLTNYLALQKIRVSNRAKVEINMPPELLNNNELRIAPLLLIVLLENAFKHGVDATDQMSWLKAELRVEQGKLLFSCTNSVDIRYFQNQQSSGIGLENLKRRLALIYPQQHQLLINKSDDTFSVELTLEITNNERDNHA